MTALITTITLAAAVTVSATLILGTANPPPRPGLTPLHVRGCHPIDAADLTGDLRYGEQETLDDEDEIRCVGDKQFRRLRAQLGLRGRAPAAV